MDVSVAASNDRMLPVRITDGLSYFTNGVLAGAGRFQHEDTEPVHSHSFVEIVVSLSGEGVHRSLRGAQRLSTGDVVVLRPGSWHCYEECRELRIFNLCFSAELLRRELSWMREDPLLGYLLWDATYAPQQRGTLTFCLNQDELHECAAHLDALHALVTAPLPLFRSDVVGRLALALGLLARAADSSRDHQPIRGDRPTHPAAIQAIRLLESRPEHDWTLSELADELHITPSYLVRAFKSATGLPPMAYLARHRAETAAVLLHDTNDTMGRIGAAVGWPDRNYFSRRFKTHFGVSPTQYRARGIRTGLGPGSLSV